MPDENQNPEVEEEHEEVAVCDECHQEQCICCRNCGLLECGCCPECGRYKCVCEQYYADFDEDGNITGFYVNTINDVIPQGAMPITTADWQMYSSDAGKYKLDGDTIREKTQQELDDEAAARPPREPSPLQILQEENALLSYQLMLEKSRNDNHDADIALLYHGMMLGGAGA